MMEGLGPGPGPGPETLGPRTWAPGPVPRAPDPGSAGPAPRPRAPGPGLPQASPFERRRPAQLISAPAPMEAFEGLEGAAAGPGAGDAAARAPRERWAWLINQAHAFRVYKHLLAFLDTRFDKKRRVKLPIPRNAVIKMREVATDLEKRPHKHLRQIDLDDCWPRRQ